MLELPLPVGQRKFTNRRGRNAMLDASCFTSTSVWEPRGKFRHYLCGQALRRKRCQCCTYGLFQRLFLSAVSAISWSTRTKQRADPWRTTKCPLPSVIFSALGPCRRKPAGTSPFWHVSHFRTTTIAARTLARISGLTGHEKRRRRFAARSKCSVQTEVLCVTMSVRWRG